MNFLNSESLKSGLSVIKLIICAALSACTTTNAEVMQNAVIVTRGDGGSVYGTLAQYSSWSAQGKKIIIDGNMISSDAFGAFSAPNVCYTENAAFSPHAVSYAGLIPHYGVTEQLTGMLPMPLQKEFRSSGHYYNWVTTAHFDYNHLLEIWAEGACVNQ